MPAANQQPAPGQPFPLPIDRQTSTIPKAIIKEGESPYWVYPSQQVSFSFIVKKMYFLLDQLYEEY